MKRFVFIFLIGFWTSSSLVGLQAQDTGKIEKTENDTITQNGGEIEGEVLSDESQQLDVEDGPNESQESIEEEVSTPPMSTSIQNSENVVKNSLEYKLQKNKKRVNWWAWGWFAWSLLLLGIIVFLVKRYFRLDDKYIKKKEELESLNKKYFDLKTTGQKQNQRSILAKPDIPTPSQEKAIEDPIEKPTTVTLSPEISDEKMEKTYFLGKPDRENFFTSLSTAPDEFTTIFKLTVNADNEDLAEFEVQLDLDSQLGKEVINNPDDFLYRVCEALNVNTDFNSTITTVRKGKAVKENGDWKMKEKAVIQFA